MAARLSAGAAWFERDPAGGVPPRPCARDVRFKSMGSAIRRLAKRLRDRATITSPFLAGPFGRRLRCSLLTDPLPGYARRSRLASGQNSCAIKGEVVFARSLRAGRVDDSEASAPGAMPLLRFEFDNVHLAHEWCWETGYESEKERATCRRSDPGHPRWQPGGSQKNAR